MAHDPADETLSSDEIHEALEANEPIADELLEAAADVPIVEPRGEPISVSSSPGQTRAAWFFGTVVIALLAVQTAQPFLSPAPGGNEPSIAAAGPAAPVVARASPAEEIDRTLREMRVHLSRGLYEDVRRLLEPLVDDPARLDRDQRFEALIMLAKAYRSLGNVEKAQHYSLLATDQMIERREPAEILEFAGTLANDRRQDEARVELMKLLARRDGFSEKDAPWLSLAEARIADAWYTQAKQSGHLAPLPGARAPESGR